MMQNLMNMTGFVQYRIALFLFLINIFVIMQTNAQVIDSVANTRSLEITYYKTTSIIFSSAIKNVDRGCRDILAQKTRGVENILQLKAGSKDFPQTNLTVITADGKLHHFIVNYAAEPEKLIIDVTKTGLFETGNSFAIFTSPISKKVLEEYAHKILFAKRNVRFVSNRNAKISLSLQGIYIQDNTIFFHLKLKNRSNVDYDIDLLRFYIRDQELVKRTASQEVEVKPMYVYGDEKKSIQGRSEIDLVYALKKFTISDAKHLAVEMFEKNGGRNLKLMIKNRTVVNARPVPDNHHGRI